MDTRDVFLLFFDAKGVFFLAQTHVRVRQRENAIGGVDELTRSHKKKSVKYRQEQRQRRK